MPRILIIEATIVSYGDDRGGVHQSPGDLCDVSKDVARALVQADRALYADRKDDPSRGGIYTASKDMLKTAARLAGGRKPAGPKDGQGSDAGDGQEGEGGES